MPYMSREKFALWHKNTIAAIECLNRILGNNLTGEGYYNLEYRDKNHRIVLTHDGFTIARGIYAINEAIKNLYIYYHLN